MKEKVLYYSKKAIFAVIAIMTLLTLCFTLLKLDARIYGYSFKENGFNLLDFDSKFTDWAGTVYGILSIIELVVAVSVIVLSVINFFTDKFKLGNIIIACAISVAVAYMVEGIVFKAVYNKYQGDGLLDDYLSTAAFVPMILQTVFVASYIVVNAILKINKSNVGVAKTEVVASLEPEKKNNLSVLEELKKWKELLDMGVITQDEFDIKKKELLK